MGDSPSASKRLKIESTSLQIPPPVLSDHEEEEEEEAESEHCAICLQPITDRTLVPTCSHEFCFECLMVWSEQSRRCPLCSQGIGDHLIHRIRSNYDYQKHYLPPLRTSPRPLERPSARLLAHTNRRPRREREWGRRDIVAQEEADTLERAVSHRRWIYRHDLYAKHVASNAYTRYRPYPTPSQFSASPDLISRTTIFLRRELQVWPNSDIEFLVTFVISLMKSIDIRAESAVKLLSEFLDMDTPYVPGGRHVNAEHFAHEIYCYLRSPYRDLTVYDSVVQYDPPADVLLRPSHERSRRWERASRSPSPPMHRGRNTSDEIPPPVSHSKYPHRQSDREKARDRHSSSRSATPPRRPDKGKRPLTPLHVETPAALDTPPRPSSPHELPAASIHDEDLPGPSTLRTRKRPAEQSPSVEEATSAVPLPTNSGIRREPRRRSLFDSVQAHLRPSLMDAASRQGLGATSAVEDPAKFRSSAVQSGRHIPSLLARMSDDVLDTGNGLTSTGSDTRVECIGSSSEKVSSRSAPDIMARTRARLAQSRAPAVTSISDADRTHSSTPIDPSSASTPQELTPETPHPAPLPRSPPSPSTPEASSVSGLRSRLLDKLEAERSLARDPGVNNSFIQNGQDDRASRTAQTPGRTVSMAEAVLSDESGLRAQGRLRVRLAAERRLADARRSGGGSPGSGGVQRETHDGERLEGMDSGAVAGDTDLEGILRATLRSRSKAGLLPVPT